MATISLQVAPANSYRTSTYHTISKDPRHHDGNVHEALHEIYVLAKQDMEQMSAEPPQKKRRLNADIARDEGYVVLAKAILELVCSPSVIVACLRDFILMSPLAVVVKQELTQR